MFVRYKRIAGIYRSVIYRFYCMYYRNIEKTLIEMVIWVFS